MWLVLQLFCLFVVVVVVVVVVFIKHRNIHGIARFTIHLPLPKCSPGTIYISTSSKFVIYRLTFMSPNFRIYETRTSLD